MAAKGGRVANIDVGDCVELAEALAGLPEKAQKVSARRPVLSTAPLAWSSGRGIAGRAGDVSGNGQTTREQRIDRYNLRSAAAPFLARANSTTWLPINRNWASVAGSVHLPCSNNPPCDLIVAPSGVGQALSA